MLFPPRVRLPSAGKINSTETKEVVVQDLWEECYTGQHRKSSPEQFRQTFCANCMNAGCKNSKGAGMSWVKRIMTQEDVLLNNPQFADPSDPRFNHLVDFQDKLREALAIEVSTRRGDWEIPTDRDIGQAAADLMGLSPPGYQAPPPEKLVDDVKMTGLDGKPVEETTPPPPDPDSVDDRQTWKVLGTGNTWEVSLTSGEWACTCPGWDNLKRCKHVQKIRERVEDSAPGPTPPPAPDPVRTPVKAPENVRKMNTDQPVGGVMIGGSAPPPQEADPWAPSKPKEKILPLGGKVKFKS